MRRRRNKEVIAGRVNANGTIAAGDEFQVRKPSAGAYYITFPLGFRLLSIVAATGGVNTVMFSGSYTENSALISTTTASDTFFSFIAVGYQT